MIYDRAQITIMNTASLQKTAEAWKFASAVFVEIHNALTIYDVPKTVIARCRRFKQTLN